MPRYMIMITYLAKPGCKQAFVDAVTEAGILSLIRQEDGCRQYQYYYPADQEDIILLVEEWESIQHQQVHMTQPHMAELMRLKAEYILETKLNPLQIL